MSYEMKSLRKEDISLYYYIKDVVLSDFVEKDEQVSLELMELLSTPNIDSDTPSYVYEAITATLPSPTERGRGWTYFDEDTVASGYLNTVVGTRADGISISGVPEQSNRVIVYTDYTVVSGVIVPTGVISDTEYMIDYIDGRIVTSGTCSPVYVDYYWNYVSVVDEWAAVEAADPPVVVIDMHGTDKTGYQLGGGKMVTRKVDIHIFATSTAERNDIVETIYNGLYLKSAPILDLPLGTALDYDGTWYWRRNNMNKLETLFDISRTALDINPNTGEACGATIGNMRFDNVTARHVNLPLLMTRSTDEVMLSDLNAYRSKISFDMVSYTHV
jgi:hypothetical protein